MRGLKSGREREVETNGADEHISRFFPPTAFILAGRFVALLDLLSGNALLLQRSFRDVYCFPIRVPARIFVLATVPYPTPVLFSLGFASERLPEVQAD